MALGKRRIRIDGWDKQTRTVYQFHGCLFHGHPNWAIARGKEINLVKNKPLEALYAETCKIHNHLNKDVWVKVVKKWECELQQEKTTNKELKDFLKKKFNRPDPFKNITTLTKTTLSPP